MATSFSWSDTIHIALSSCLPCFFTPSRSDTPSLSTDSLLINPNDPTFNRIRRARPDELEGLLADVTDTDAEAERMSLHSNPGRTPKWKTKRRNKRKRAAGDAGKRITLFGYDLFGKPKHPPVYLPESDGEADIAHHVLATTRSSSLTFDSDASPLDPAAIDTISSSTAHLTQQALVPDAAAEEQREKEERREKRRQRKEMKRAARALALSAHGGGQTVEDGFEGFQGSGDGYSGIPAQMYAHGEEYGPFLRAPGIHKDNLISGNEDGGDADAADFDGGLYTNKTANGTSSSGSDSRSRTSASQSNLPIYSSPLLEHQTQAPARVYTHPQPPLQAQSPMIDPTATTTEHQPKAKRNSKSKKVFPLTTATSSTSKESGSSASTSTFTSQSQSQSPSLASPISSVFPVFERGSEMVRTVVGPEADDDGAFKYGRHLESKRDLPPSHSTSRLGDAPGDVRGTFPSAGFGAGPGRTKGARNAYGAFLATRG